MAKHDLPRGDWEHVVDVLDTVAALEAAGGDEAVILRALNLRAQVADALSRTADASFALSLSGKDESFLRARVRQAAEIARVTLASDTLPPDVRPAQEASLAAALRLGELLD